MTYVPIAFGVPTAKLIVASGVVPREQYGLHTFSMASTTMVCEVADAVPTGIIVVVIIAYLLSQTLQEQPLLRNWLMMVCVCNSLSLSAMVSLSICVWLEHIWSRIR